MLVTNRAMVENRLLTALLQDEYERLYPHMEVFRLSQNKVLYLYEADDADKNVYFPNKGMVSLLATSENGMTIEVAGVGNEGVVGLPVIMQHRAVPHNAMIHLTSDIVKIKGKYVAAEFNRRGGFHDLLMHYSHVLLTQSSQSVVCNHFHTTEKRLCRWLLFAHDCVKTDTLHLTHETIGNMLGIPRTAVTMAAGTLQTAGFINYSRGKIVIRDRRGLASASCECYQIVKEAFTRFIDRYPLPKASPVLR